MSVVLVVAAHADDEVLGCGGAMARHADEGDVVHVLLMADGVSSRKASSRKGSRSKTAEARASAADRANRTLGVATLTQLGLPDNRMDGLDLLEIVRPVEREIDRWKPEIIYTHHPGDLNVDHRLTSQAVATAARPQPGTSVHDVYFFEVLSSTDYQIPGAHFPFVPNRFVDVAACLERKLAALRIYSEEMRPWPHARSIEAVTHLARARGASVGMTAAEAFQVGRMLVR